MVRTIALRGALIVALVSVSGAAAAQPPTQPEPGRFEVSGAFGWWGGYDLGTASANLPPSSGGGTLYEAEASIAGGAAASARFGWRAFRQLSIEGAVTYGRARLQSTVRSDVDPTLNASLDTALRQLAVEAGALLPLPGAAMAGDRLVPFISGGGGYLQQLDDEGVLLETGGLAYGGGGLRMGLGAAHPDRFVKRIGLRADVRLVVRTRGIDVEDRARAFVTLLGGAYIRF